VFKPATSNVQKLWRPGNKALQAMARVQELCHGYVSVVEKGIDDRAGKQREGILSCELQMGDMERTGKQQKR
jgi:hypothetical protein